ncbi:hypothetical protein LX36DRAFT_283049 [Colletotrichum falcatum]|nr:hypothetical protein LX36DRAFT_283049 [Colletotrichum falcatum]
MESEFAEAMFRHPSTACGEQNLNSVVVRPEQGERICLAEANGRKTDRIRVYAYHGGGHELCKKVEVSLDDDDDDASGADEMQVLFRHPAEPGTADGGWMKPSVANQAEAMRRDAGTPQKQFTGEGVERHHKEDDYWVVVEGEGHDATSVVAWHPGGKAPVMAPAGPVPRETTEEFGSVHDGLPCEELQRKSCRSGASRAPPRCPHGQGGELDQGERREAGRREGHGPRRRGEGSTRFKNTNGPPPSWFAERPSSRRPRSVVLLLQATGNDSQGGSAGFERLGATKKTAICLVSEFRLRDDDDGRWRTIFL